MPAALRAQVALVALLGVLLIPVATSSLRGLTHVLTCQDESATPFSVQVPEDGAPTISSSTVIERTPEGEVPSAEVCGGLELDLTMGATEPGEADLTLTITNHSDHGWRGSVQVDLAGVTVPIDIGHVDSGESVSDTTSLRLDQGRTYEISGTLLIGP